MITADEVLMGRDKEYPLDGMLKANLQILLTALNKFRAAYGKPMRVTSGYRPGKYNVAAGGAKRSNHMVCLACDFADPGGELANYCLTHQDVLESCGLYLEDPAHTPGWVHLQTPAPASKKRIFLP